MNNADKEVEWSLGGCPGAVKYSPSLWQAITTRVVEGLLRVPWGGPEVGGILFGRHEADCVRILDFRPLAFDHAGGPAFEISETNEALLREALERALTEKDLRELQPVGWYQSKWSNFWFSSKDVDLYSRFFPEPWQVAMVFMRLKSGAGPAGFYFRGEDGTLHSSSREFDLRAESEKLVACSLSPVEEVPTSHMPQATTCTHHSKVLAKLLYGIEGNKGLIVLTGESGTGKTAMLQCLGDNLNQRSIQFAFLAHPPATTEQFYEMLAYDLDLQCSRIAKTAVLFALTELVMKQAAVGRPTALIVDDAHNLPSAVLQELGMLDFLHASNRILLNVVLCGQPALENKLEDPAFAELKQRIVVRCIMHGVR